MWIVALGVLYIGFAVVVGRVCRLNSQLEDLIVRESAELRGRRVAEAVPVAPRSVASGSPRVDELADSRSLHGIPAIR
jgi:hypothetical protein